eukprot:12897896-Prorocentrum_lima.AAC.3
MEHPRLGLGTFQYFALATTAGLMQFSSLAYISRQLGRIANRSSSRAFPATSAFGRLTASARSCSYLFCFPYIASAPSCSWPVATPPTRRLCQVQCLLTLARASSLPLEHAPLGLGGGSCPPPHSQLSQRTTLHCSVYSRWRRVARCRRRADLTLPHAVYAGLSGYGSGKRERSRWDSISLLVEPC